jgi:hypothetical protein
MSKARASILFLFLAALQLVQPVALRAADAKPEEYKLQYHLIWGTNGEKPEDPRLKDLDPFLRSTIGKFKWNNYWEVSRKIFTVQAGKTNHVVVSRLCELDVRHLDGQNFEIKLFGEKKLVAHRMKESFASGKALVLAGDDKNDSAWFVVIVAVPTSTTKAPRAPVEAGKTNKSGSEGTKTNKPVVNAPKSEKPAADSGSK